MITLNQDKILIFEILETKLSQYCINGYINLSNDFCEASAIYERLLGKNYVNLILLSEECTEIYRCRVHQQCKV